jgi:hypothetical protein
MVWPASMEWKTGGSPGASTITPTICTIVATRNAQSSVSSAEANQEKLIQHQQTAKTAITKPIKPAAKWPSAAIYTPTWPR